VGYPKDFDWIYRPNDCSALSIAYTVCAFFLVSTGVCVHSCFYVRRCRAFSSGWLRRGSRINRYFSYETRFQKVFYRKGIYKDDIGLMASSTDQHILPKGMQSLRKFVQSSRPFVKLEYFLLNTNYIKV